ncbi:MAG: transposase zinc-binding domain-containing protein [Sandaracinaceae bacterium]|nr:transposase zinc-binding domain-containing protein [Sandaracinaceae bacterium]
MDTYRPRRPADSALHRVLTEHIETFLDDAAMSRADSLPRFVATELREFLRCGILSEGFARMHCDHCGHDRLVGLSCKGRGFCPSCGGRRMTELAASRRQRPALRAHKAMGLVAAVLTTRTRCMEPRRGARRSTHRRACDSDRLPTSRAQSWHRGRARRSSLRHSTLWLRAQSQSALSPRGARRSLCAR